jgi:uncharacterized protein (DUF2267 family)
MGYRELIHTMQKNAGFSDSEAQEALDLMVESIAERLEDGERKDFASQLPAELQEVALSTEMAEREDRQEDLIHEFMEKEHIEEDRAKKQIMTAWETLKSFITEGQIMHIRAQLPAPAAALLQ